MPLSGLLDLALRIEQIHWIKQALDLVLDPVDVFAQFNIVPLVLQHPYGMFAGDGPVLDLFLQKIDHFFCIVS